MFKWPLFRKHEWEHTIYRLPKTAILSFLDLCSLTCWWYVKSDDIQAKNSKRAFECFFRGLLVIIDSEIVAHFWRNTFPKTSYSLMTFGDLKINLSEKNDWGNIPMYSLRAMERCFPRLSIPLSFWVSWCGHFDPPDRGEGGWETPPWRGLIGGHFRAW